MVKCRETWSVKHYTDTEKPVVSDIRQIARNLVRLTLDRYRDTWSVRHLTDNEKHAVLGIIQIPRNLVRATIISKV